MNKLVQCGVLSVYMQVVETDPAEYCIVVFPTTYSQRQTCCIQSVFDSIVLRIRARAAGG